MRPYHDLDCLGVIVPILTSAMTASVDPASVGKDELERVLRLFVNSESVEHLSRKLARRELERRLNLPEDALKSRRDEVNSILENLVSEIRGEGDQEDNAEVEEEGGEPPEDSNGVDEAGEQSDGGDEEDSEPRSKKQKLGPDPPKNLKKAQADIMTKSEFLKLAMVLETHIGPHLKFDLKPRTFSSGSCGWYHGGKVEIPVGRQKIWCQLGINCTVLGSKDWEETKKRKR